MGRRKVEIKKIENKTSRQVTFSKRRAGLIKKAKHFSVLYDADVAVVIVSNSGKPYEFCSTDSLDNLLHRYHIHAEVHGEEGAGVKPETSNPEGKGFLSIRELLEQVKRVGQADVVDQLNVCDLVHLEEQLEDALSHITSKKEKMLTEENRHLIEKISQSKYTVLDVKKKGLTMESLAAADGMISAGSPPRGSLVSLRVGPSLPTTRHVLCF